MNRQDEVACLKAGCCAELEEVRERVKAQELEVAELQRRAKDQDSILFRLQIDVRALQTEMRNHAERVELSLHRIISLLDPKEPPTRPGVPP